MSRHESINIEARGAHEVRMFRGTWFQLYTEYENLKKQNDILIEVLTKIASLNMLPQEIAIATPEQLYNDTCVDIQSAREALKKIKEIRG